jgi:hypothetical protein
VDGRVKPGHDEQRIPPMILIGQYDAPFVGRVAIALRLHGSRRIICCGSCRR